MTGPSTAPGTGCVELNDGLPMHPAIIGLSDSAFRLWLEALCYASRNSTNRYVPAALVPNRRRHVTELTDAGLWSQHGDGYRINARPVPRGDRPIAPVIPLRATAADGPR